MALHIVGDVNLYVEGNMHSEVEGDRFDRVNGNYQMQVGGVATIQSDENLAIQAKNEMVTIQCLHKQDSVLGK